MKLHELSTKLPMDKESRLRRAKEMGFDTSKVWYHGTRADFTSFNTTTNGAAEGVYMDDSAYKANIFARNEGGNVIACYVRGVFGTRQDMLDASNSGGGDLVSASEKTKIMQSKGLDGYYDEIHSELVVFGPSNIRSVNAIYDPTKNTSGELNETT